MGVLEIIFIAISLALDAFVVSISNGILIDKIKIKYAFKFGMFFGFFQFIMPIIGYYLVNLFGKSLLKFDYLIAFFLLNIIGIKMIVESLKKQEKENVYDKKHILSVKNLTVLGIATSIDSLAVGVSFSFVETKLLISSLIIGIVAFIFSFIGVILGEKIGKRLSKNSEIIGGVILIVIAFKILIQHF